jgi:hypothetical protein
MSTNEEHEIVVESFKQSQRKRTDGSYYNGRWTRSSAGERISDPMRVFIDFKGETVWANLNNRRVRPVTTLRKAVEAALFLEGITYSKIRWSQKAGCRMCPCSPGFIVEGTTWEHRQDYWLTLTDKSEYPQTIA